MTFDVPWDSVVGDADLYLTSRCQGTREDPEPGIEDLVSIFEQQLLAM